MKLAPDPRLVAKRYGVDPGQIYYYEQWIHVFFVKIEGLGCRFVPFDMAVSQEYYYPATKVKPVEKPKPQVATKRKVEKPVIKPKIKGIAKDLVYLIIRTCDNQSSYLGLDIIRVFAEDLVTKERWWYTTWKEENAQPGQIWKQSSDPETLIPLSRDPELQQKLKDLGYKV